jgi:citrate synthase
MSHVDGKAGELIIGGYELKDPAGRVALEEAAHLLWRGAFADCGPAPGLASRDSGAACGPESRP